MAKLQTRKYGVFSADEISGLKSQYDEPLNRNDYFKYVILPGAFVGGYFLITTYFWWLTLIGFVVGAIYGYIKILPNIIKSDYDYNALVERDTFCLNMTQILSDPTKTLSSALGRAVVRANGEFKKDLRVLQANITGSGEDTVKQVFQELREKYKNDVSFIQYLEQLETSYLDGSSNVESLKEITSQHQQILKKTVEFRQKKQQSFKENRIMMAIPYALILVLEFSFGFQVTFEAYSRSVIGYVTTTIFGIFFFITANSLRKRYFDEDIMSIRHKAKQ